MKVKEAIDRLKIMLHDVSDEYDTYHSLMRLNEAAQLTSTLLVQIASPLILHEAVLHTGDRLPKNFLRFAGIYPIRRTGETVELLADIESMSVRYYKGVDAMESKDDDMPFEHDTLNDFVIKTAVKYALNRNEFDISQDQNLLQELQNAAAEAMG